MKFSLGRIISMNISISSAAAKSFCLTLTGVLDTHRDC